MRITQLTTKTSCYLLLIIIFFSIKQRYVITFIAQGYEHEIHYCQQYNYRMSYYDENRKRNIRDPKNIE